MAGEFEIKDAQSMLDEIRETRINMNVFSQNTNIPGEMSSLARAFYKHIPELAKRMGSDIEAREGHPPQVVASDKGLVDMIARDLKDGRDMANWLSATTTGQSKAFFAQGRDNAIDGLLQRFSEERGFQRTDSLAVEAGRIQPEPPEQDRSRPPAAAFAAHMASQYGR